MGLRPVAVREVGEEDVLGVVDGGLHGASSAGSAATPRGPLTLVLGTFLPDPLDVPDSVIRTLAVQLGLDRSQRRRQLRDPVVAHRAPEAAHG